MMINLGIAVVASSRPLALLLQVGYKKLRFKVQARVTKEHHPEPKIDF